MKMSLWKLASTLLLISVVDIGRIDLPKATSQDKALGPEVNGSDLFPRELVDFVPDSKDPVFTGAGPGHWDARIRERGWILREGDLYRMWYTGFERDSSPMLKLGYATGPDGIHWTHHAQNPPL